MTQLCIACGRPLPESTLHPFCINPACPGLSLSIETHYGAALNKIGELSRSLTAALQRATDAEAARVRAEAERDEAREAIARHDVTCEAIGALPYMTDAYRLAIEERDAARSEAEQYRVQLAGCSVAALGGANGDNDASPGDYGHSVAFDDVKRLRAAHDRALADLAALHRQVAEIVGIMYEADGHASQPGPIDAVLQAVRDAVRRAGMVDEAVGEVYAANERAERHKAHAIEADRRHSEILASETLLTVQLAAATARADQSDRVLATFRRELSAMLPDFGEQDGIESMKHAIEAFATARAERIERETVERCATWLRAEAENRAHHVAAVALADAADRIGELAPAPVDADARGERGGDGGGR